ncbi:MmgE/PrpD family protein [Candidatus Formimonas warabiya]|uniref:MmgE/PrpD family protein n=1 Tax=Formimonas warabiya TaxID=1761012 RepID=UPI001BE3D9BE|nr:MmgE/PrpD family protein [Candidatus Formimonas warabiya]
MAFAEQAAEYVNALHIDDISSSAADQAEVCFKDWLGVAWAGSKTPTGQVVRNWLAAGDYHGCATVLGYPIQVNEMEAALANGVFGHVLDYDDIYPWGPGHPSSTVMPAVLALGEKLGISGKAALEAIIAGFQVQYAVGEAIMPEHYQTGWHNTATLGHIGAAAAAAKVMNLAKDEIRHAIGIAATSAGGLQSVFGSMAKSYNAGKAAMDGVLAAITASHGYDSSLHVFEGHGGFWRVFASKYDEKKAVQALEKGYVVERVRFKYYPSCYSTHGIIECMKGIREQTGPEFAPRDVKKITCYVHPRCIDIAAIPEPKTGLEGKFSVQFCGAYTLMKGDIILDDFSDESVGDPTCRYLMSITGLVVDPGFTEERKAAAVVEMKDATKFIKEINLVEMTQDVVKTNQNVETKFHDLMKDHTGTVALIKKGMRNIADIRSVTNSLRIRKQDAS